MLVLPMSFCDPPVVTGGLDCDDLLIKYGIVAQTLAVCKVYDMLQDSLRVYFRERVGIQGHVLIDLVQTGVCLSSTLAG